MVRGSWRQELEVVSHNSPVNQKAVTGEAWGSVDLPPFLFYLVQEGTAHIQGESSLFSQTILEHDHRQMKKCVSQVISNPVKLTVLITCVIRRRNRYSCR